MRKSSGVAPKFLAWTTKWEEEAQAGREGGAPKSALDLPEFKVPAGRGPPEA